MKKIPFLLFALLFILSSCSHKSATDSYEEGILLGEEGQYEESLKAFNDAISKDAAFRDAYNNRGFYAKLNLEDYAGAIEDFTTAINVDSTDNDAFAYSNRGFAKYKLKDFRGALKDFKESEKLDPNNPYLYRNMAIMMFDINNPDAACFYANKAMVLGYEVIYKRDDLKKLMDEHCPKSAE